MGHALASHLGRAHALLARRMGWQVPPLESLLKRPIAVSVVVAESLEVGRHAIRRRQQRLELPSLEAMATRSTSPRTHPCTATPPKLILGSVASGLTFT